MKRARTLPDRDRQGSVLVLSLIFLAMFSALAAAMATMSGTNVQIAENQRQASRALASAQSGVEVLRYYLTDVNIPAVAPGDRLDSVFNSLQGALVGTNISVSYNSTTKTLAVPSVALDSGTNQSFAATMTYDGSDFDTLHVVVTGSSREATKQVGVNYHFATVGNPIFDWGIATKGPLKTQGNVDIEGFNEAFEASIYIESLNSSLALDMTGKSSIAGSVTIANGSANVSISSSSSVHGAKGEAAMRYITIGAAPQEFPTPNPIEFAGYIQTTFNPATDPTSNVTLTNVEIPPNANPSFSGNTVIRGILYIHPPNAVSFTGNATIHGLIVAEGVVADPSELNHLDFGGNVTSYDVSTLPPEQFGDLTQQTGTFILAPGFSVRFRGNFSTVNGVIAASGVQFQGNAGGTINGSVINYSNDRMELAGNTDLVFNRSGRDKVPAGFQPSTTLQFMPESYCEGVL